MIEMLKSKLCRLKVTAVNPQADGAMEIDGALMRSAMLRPFQRLMVVNRETGLRFETFALPVPDAGAVRLNGADARLAEPGDFIDVEVFQVLDESKVDSQYACIRIVVDENNLLKKPKNADDKAAVAGNPK
jgi:aspartate 1-decarboxylase